MKMDDGNMRILRYIHRSILNPRFAV
jgi:hypothetical protein